MIFTTPFMPAADVLVVSTTLMSCSLREGNQRLNAWGWIKIVMSVLL